MTSRRQCHVARQDGLTLVAVGGRLDARGRRRLGEAIWRAIERRDRRLVVDLSQVSHVDPLARAVLLGLERIAEHQAGCDVDIRGLPMPAA